MTKLIEEKAKTIILNEAWAEESLSECPDEVFAELMAEQRFDEIKSNNGFVAFLKQREASQSNSGT